MIKTVNFGDEYGGLTTVGYTLINSDGSIYQSRTTSGIFEIQTDSGIYGVDLNFNNPTNLIILWDDGQDEPLYASEEIYIDNTDTTSILDIVTEIDNKSDIIINTTNIIDDKIDLLSTDCTNIDEKIDIINNTVNIIDNKIDLLSTDCTNLSIVVNDIDNKSDIIINTTNDIDNKIDNLSIDCTNLDSKIDILNIKCDEISDDLKRVLGLVHENIFIDLPSYDDDSNLISARLRIYSNPLSVGTNNNILATYIIESDSSGPGKFTNWKQVRS